MTSSIHVRIATIDSELMQYYLWKNKIINPLNIDQFNLSFSLQSLLYNFVRQEIFPLIIYGTDNKATRLRRKYAKEIAEYEEFRKTLDE